MRRGKLFSARGWKISAATHRDKIKRVESAIAKRCTLRCILFAACCIIIAGCRGKIAVLGSENREISNSESRIEYVERLRDTVIYITLPQESVEREVMADSSFLQTSLAVSTAALLPDGSLFHSLANKPEPVAAGISLPERETTMEYVERSLQSRITEVPVKLPLTKLEKFLLISGIVLWAGAIVLLLRWIIF